MKDWNLSELIHLLTQSGRIALRHFDSPERNFKNDRSLVTQADHEIEQMLAAHFNHPEDGVYMIGEETVSQHNQEYLDHALTDGVSWIVDPIDGTAPYANHLPNWGVSIARMEAGQITDGAIIVPCFNEVFLTDGEQVLYCHDPEWSFTELKPIPPPHRPFDDSCIVSISQRMSKTGRFELDNPVQTLCSCVYSFARLLDGSFSAYIATVKIWDMAAGMTMARRLGYVGRLCTGESITDRVDSTCFILEADADHRWALRDHGIVAQDDATIDLILGNVALPE